MNPLGQALLGLAGCLLAVGALAYGLEVFLARRKPHRLCGGHGCRLCGWSGRRYRSAVAGWLRRRK